MAYDGNFLLRLCLSGEDLRWEMILCYRRQRRNCSGIENPQTALTSTQCYRKVVSDQEQCIIKQKLSPQKLVVCA